MPSSGRVAIGLVGVGPGSIAQLAHLPSLKRIPEAEIVAAASRSRTDIGLPARVYTEWAEMLDRERLDLLYVLSPTATHPAIVQAALARGIHVLCEKPPALTVEDTAAMVEAAQKRGLVLLFGFNRRFAPNYVRLKQLASERGCHTLVMVKTRGQTAPFEGEAKEAANRRWSEMALVQGGPIFEFIPHLFDLALWVNGAVTGYTFHTRPLYGSAVNVSALGVMEHANGARSVLVFEVLAGDPTERVTLYGPALTAEVVGGTLAHNTLTVWDHGERQEFPGAPDLVEYGGFLQMSQHLIACVREGRPVRFAPSAAVESVRLALAFDPQGRGVQLNAPARQEITPIGEAR